MNNFPMKREHPVIYQVPVFKQLGEQCCLVRNDIFDINSRIVLHHHEFYELFLVLDAPIIHLFNNAEYLLAPQTLVFIRPDDLHTFRVPNKNARVSTKNIPFIKPLFSRACELLSAAQITALQEIRHCHAICLDIQWNALLAKAHWLEAELLQNTLNAEQLMISLILDAINILLPGSSSPNSMPQWLLNTIQAMRLQENYTEGVPQMVKLSGHSAEHVSRSMKKYLNRTPSSFINQTRLNAAAHLLKTTDRSVTDILFDVGYESVSHFTREFRKQFGVSARDYRNRAWAISSA